MVTFLQQRIIWWWSRLQWACAVVAMAVGLVVLTVACGGGATPGATASGTQAATTSDGTPSTPMSSTILSTSATPSAIAYAECMRANGVPDFPDPNSDGGFTLHVSPGGLDPHSQQFQTAQQTCKPLLPPGIGTPNPTAAAQQLQQDLQYAACMRANGVSNFPDPSMNASGGVDFLIESNIDTSSPQYQAAQQACQSLLPNGSS